MQVRVRQDVAVSPNLAAGLHTACAFPSACALADGGVIVAYRRGMTKHSLDGTLVCQRSDDHGRTWGQPAVIHNGLGNTPPESMFTGVVGQADAAVLAFFTANDVRDPKSFIFSDEGRRERQRFHVAGSRDGGRTWSPPREHRFEGLPHLIYVAHRPVPLADGDLLLSMEATGALNHQYAFTTLYSPAREAFHSVVLSAEDPSGRISYGDAKLSRLADGRILMLLWAFDTQTDETIEVHRSVSADNGRSWSTPTPVNLRCQITVPLTLDDGRILAASNVRTPPDGIRLWCSSDEGATWHTPVQMWDPHAGRVVGEPLAVTGGNGNKVWQALPGFTFGTPDLIRLNDGTLLLTYYATLNEIIHVRACSFQV